MNQSIGCVAATPNTACMNSRIACICQLNLVSAQAQGPCCQAGGQQAICSDEGLYAVIHKTSPVAQRTSGGMWVTVPSELVSMREVAMLRARPKSARPRPHLSATRSL